VSGRWRDAALALLLANLCFARVWSGLIDYSAADSFFFLRPPPPAAYLALWANLLLWTAGLWAVLYGLRRYRVHSLLSGTLFFAACLFPLNAIREILSTRLVMLRSGLFAAVGTERAAALVVLAALLLMAIVWRWGTRLQAVGVAALFCTAPLLAVEVAGVVWRLAAAPTSEYANGSTVPFQRSVPGAPRIVWIIFDEMDYRLSFPERPKTLSLPEFDRLSGQAIHLTDALSPANSTAVSVPALLHGAVVREFRSSGPRQAEIAYSDTLRAETWSSRQTIFSSARQLGYNSAVVGWYLPYCRALKDDLSECEWTDISSKINSNGTRFGEMIFNQNRGLFETSLFSPFGQSLTVERHIQTIESNLRHARQAVTDARLGLVFLHFPVPHPPAVYDRSRGTMTLSNGGISGYIDSLALADRILGQLRRDMEGCGLWSATTLLVTADHSFRSSMALDGKYDPRVPYILKLANQSAGLRYDGRFETVHTRGLLEDILRGNVRSPDDAVERISRPGLSGQADR
jgi:hypothetical protein